VVVADRLASTGAINAFDSEGGLLWTALDGGSGATTAPIVGGQGVYVAVSNGSDSSIRRLDLMNGTPALLQMCPDIGGGFQFDGDLALGGNGATEIPFGVRNGVLCAATGTWPSQAVTVTGLPSVVATTSGNTH